MLLSGIIIILIDFFRDSGVRCHFGFLPLALQPWALAPDSGTSALRSNSLQFSNLKLQSLSRASALRSWASALGFSSRVEDRRSDIEQDGSFNSHLSVQEVPLDTCQKFVLLSLWGAPRGLQNLENTKNKLKKQEIDLKKQEIDLNNAQ